MKMALFGSTGQVGHELEKILCTLGEVQILTRHEADFANPDAVRETAEDLDVDVIVNAAAYTAVDRAEQESYLADLINHQSVRALAEAAADMRALLVHYSTDYVFDGQKTSAYTEDDLTSPLGVYGKTKLAGEQAVIESGCDYLLLRTCWVNGWRGKNFVRTMLRLAREREEIRVVDDQLGTPTSARLIAEITAELIRGCHNDRPLREIYHLSANGRTTWHGFAKAIIEKAQISGMELLCTPEQVLPISTEQYPTPAPRPKNSGLANGKLETKLARKLPDWGKELDLTITKLSKLDS